MLVNISYQNKISFICAWNKMILSFNLDVGFPQNTL